MDVEWDPRKAAENLRKHGVDFADAVIAPEDENDLTIEDRDHPEQRFKTLGLGPDLKVLFVVHAERNENLIRIISARDADRSQTKQYYQGLSYE
ncbi:BrnT family toxin [Candidatus Thiodiazotropha sp. LNASS1]|uniref:BrnT family toxin n=1 Tax=Candidatus Thiodiazotropha sp. LNASS1 TaxID=3096260 RepID=UPI00348EEE7B